MIHYEEISRITRSKEEAKVDYNVMSKWYDMLTTRFDGKYRESGLNLLEIREGEIVREIGFGTGHSILTMANLVGSRGKVYGVDISEGMYKKTQSRIRLKGLSDRVVLPCGDAVILPFESHFFNAVFMSFTLELFDTPEIPVVLHECQRVLRSNGRICVVGMSKEGKHGIMIKFFEWSHQKLQHFIGYRPIYVRRFIEEVVFKV